MKDEKTSKRVARVTGRMMRIIQENKVPASTEIYLEGTATKLCTVGELVAVLGSALTQTEDRRR